MSRPDSDANYMREIAQVFQRIADVDWLKSNGPRKDVPARRAAREMASREFNAAGEERRRRARMNRTAPTPRA